VGQQAVYGAPARHQRLRRDLPAEQAPAALRLVLAPVEIQVDLLEVHALEQTGEQISHANALAR
jgi:hypothetical protein